MKKILLSILLALGLIAATQIQAQAEDTFNFELLQVSDIQQRDIVPLVKIQKCRRGPILLACADHNMPIVIAKGTGYYCGTVGSGGGACVASGTMTCAECTDADYWNLESDAVVRNYQQVKNASSITICQIDVKLYSVTSGDVHIEIWDTGITGQIGDDSDSETVNIATPGQLYEFTWSGTQPTPSADFVIAVIEESGDIKIRTTLNNANAYEDSDYDYIAADVDQEDDAIFIVYTE